MALFSWLSGKNKKNDVINNGEQPADETVVSAAVDVAVADSGEEGEGGASSGGLFAALKRGLQRTRTSFTSGLARIFLGKKEIDANLLEELEAQLLTADVGVAVTQQIIKDLTDRVARRELSDPQVLLETLQDLLISILDPCARPLTVDPATLATLPYVILLVGVNGSGKTTTIGKLAKKLQGEGHKVLLAAGDTFRAAAIDQLKIWGERNDVAVIAQQPGADSAAVVYDAIQAARARNIDVVIADTAGRLHTQQHLMNELKKVKRTIQKLDPTAPHEVLLVLDATIGQNAINQAQQFNEAIGVTGLCITKLDGTAKGGVIFAIAQQLKLPIRFIGVGERIDDLRSFAATGFVKALFE